MRRRLPGLAAVALLVPLAGALPVGDPVASPVVLLDEDFEDALWTWGEELFPYEPCYGDGLGSVALAPDAARTGERGLLVWANAAREQRMNHVYAYTEVSARPHAGLLRYEAWARIDPATENTSQTGPEFGVHSTAHVGSGLHVTSSFGWQYVASPHSPPWWQLWTVGPRVGGMWVPFHAEKLASGVWYHAVMEADYGTRAYVRFTLEGPDGYHRSFDLTGFLVPSEVKVPLWDREALVVSVEAGNLYGKRTDDPERRCAPEGPYEARVHYDDVRLTELPRDAGSSGPRRGAPMP